MLDWSSQNWPNGRRFNLTHRFHGSLSTIMEREQMGEVDLDMDDKKRVYHLVGLKTRRRDLRKRSTNPEILLWNRLRNNQLGVKFRRQFSVMGYVVDFYCPKHRLAVELLGGIHNKLEVKKYDEYRKRYIESFRINILEVPNSEVDNNLDGVIKKIQIHFTHPVGSSLSTNVERERG